jgi:hypothetical protein
LVALVLRCIVSYEFIVDSDTFIYGVIIFFIIAFGIFIYGWAKKFAILNNIDLSRRKAFQLVVTISSKLFLGFSSAMITFFILGM